MRKGLRSTGVAVGVSGLLLATTAGVTAVPGPELEYEWEVGTAGTVYDGDTLDVKIATSNSGYTGTQRVRTIGVQAPEVAHDSQAAQCGSAQAKNALKALAPTGTPIQLRALKGTSNDDYSGGRIVRTIYAQDEEGNWFDTARQLVSDGTLLWFPLGASSPTKPEWAHNLEYRVLAEDAKSQSRGLWTPNYCGPSAGANLRMSVSWDQDSSVTGYESVFIFNDGGDLGLGGWTLRDSALNKYTFPGYASVASGRSIEVRLKAGADDPGNGVYYTGGGAWFGNLPSDNTSFTGDVAYLMDNAGPYETGNLRTWFPYPCTPDDCTDPLVGGVEVIAPVAADWNTGQDLPSSPRQVDVSAATDGTGNISISWQSPTYVGDSTGITGYRISGTEVGGAALPPQVVAAAPTSYSWTGLTAGKAYSFAVEAQNAQGWSPASAASSAVTSRKAPGSPGEAAGSAGDQQITARWVAPTADNGAPVTKYTATATLQGGGPVGTCSTGAAETSCVITGLVNGSNYKITVTATNSAGTSTPSGASTGWISPTPYSPGVAPATAPTGVTATGANGSAIVAWLPPASDGGFQITEYTVEAVGNPALKCVASGVVASPRVDPATSCVVSGLTNGSTYAFTVRASANTNGPTDPVSGPTSAQSNSAMPNPDLRMHTATGVPGPDAGTWTARETIKIQNKTGNAVDLTGYALWDKDPRSNGTPSLVDTPDYVFPRGTTIPASSTLKVRSGAPTTLEPTTSTLHYTGKSAKFNALPSGGDRIELSNLNKALVSCTNWGGVTCRGQQQVSTPTQPVGITARTTPGSVTVQWGAPISRGGTPITGYTATAFDAPNGGNVVGTCSTDGTGRACTFPGAIGARYYAEVIATNSQGTSAPSAPRVLAAPRTVPSAPGNVAVSGTPGGVNVTWTPAAENGATITRYTASAYTAGTGGKPVGTCTTSNGSLTGCTIMKLQGGTQYYIDVVATNRAGNGAASSPRTPGTPGPGGAVSTYSKGKVTVR
ncbi:MAG: fibronectin type III domain-containing protein, partial [Candidatus Nanopelagicales bacterium]|nr:fibronectin type III domain-containing protein [Candidatus Nanopelagicales bacterium]